VVRDVSAGPEIPAGLRRAFFEVLAPLALVAPLPLLWTEGASAFALLLYGCALLFLWWRARGGRPARLSNAALNALGLGYLLWLGFEVLTLRHGLLRSVSHLLLFTAVAKLASLKRPGEVRTALLVLFLIAVASASSSTHVSSLLYFGAMAFLGFRALARLAVLADFEDAPPERVLRSVPTRGMAAAAILIGAVITGPLFYALPRLRRPIATAPFRIDDAFSTTLAADRVDLESFPSAKSSNQIVLRMEVEPQSALPRVLRLREAVFTEYARGVWTRGGGARIPLPAAERLPLETRAQQLLIGQLSIDLNVSAEGFLFLPYGAEQLQVERDFATPLRDGIIRLTGGARSVRYTAAVRGVEPRGVGSTVIDPASVPPEIRDYAEKLTAGLTEPMEVYLRIRDNFTRNFLYTLTPPRGRGDPLVNFLLRSRAGHCEFFASAAAMMLTARGIPSRLATGSYGGETGFLSRALVVRGGNLHAWVEADIDGKGFTVLDPTPDAGIPPAQSRLSWQRFFSNLGREIEFFYDRRILGFDSLDQVRIIETIRQAAAGAGQGLASWKDLLRARELRRAGFAAGLAVIAVLVFLLRRRASRRTKASAATRAYLVLRRLVAARIGGLSPAIPPFEVARLFGRAVPPASGDARRVVSIYCASAFGGRVLTPEEERELKERMTRLKKLA
jgi:transglutaminase superfamily protein/transglutaminase TgpA-like protein